MNRSQSGIPSCSGDMISPRCFQSPSDSDKGWHKKGPQKRKIMYKFKVLNVFVISMDIFYICKYFFLSTGIFFKFVSIRILRPDLSSPVKPRCEFNENRSATLHSLAHCVVCTDTLNKMFRIVKFPFPCV
jgi:hypothetical protein